MELDRDGLPGCRCRECVVKKAREHKITKIQAGLLFGFIGCLFVWVGAYMGNQFPRSFEHLIEQHQTQWNEYSGIFFVMMATSLIYFYFYEPRSGK